MECVAVLMDEKTEWDHIKRVILSDANLLSKMKNLKGENINAQTKEKLKKRCNLSNFISLINLLIFSGFKSSVCPLGDEINQHGCQVHMRMGTCGQ